MTNSNCPPRCSKPPEFLMVPETSSTHGPPRAPRYSRPPEILITPEFSCTADYHHEYERPSSPHYMVDGKYLFDDSCLGIQEMGDLVIIHKKRARPLVCLVMLFSAFLVIATGLAITMTDSYNQSHAPPHYTGYCNIPIDLLKQENLQQFKRGQLIEPNYRERRVSSVHWSPKPEVQIFSTDDGFTDDTFNTLREQFDVGGRVENIRVFSKGKNISYIHDFENNVTGIVDDKRCFLMDLDPSLVMPPELLVHSIKNGDAFDLSRVHNTLRAIIPAMMDLTVKTRFLAERCYSKPTYRLQSTESTEIRKRSLETPSHDYIHFAGRHIHEMKIANIDELLEHERKQ